MSVGSERVKDWRRRFRDRIRYVMGGKCGVCGYDRCHAAFDLHHLKKDEKEFTFGVIRANPRSLAKLGAELKLCVMVCKNCHIEIHQGVTPWPKKSTFSQARFEEVLALHRTIRKPDGL